jgi:hypothetical protein
VLNDSNASTAPLVATPPRHGRAAARASSAADAGLVLDELRAYEGMVIVDLDETLYLRNSTEDFLDSAAPSLVALVVLRALDVLKPWSFTGGEPTRDVWRLVVVAFLMPWTPLLWRRRVAERARSHTNLPLLRAIQARRGPTTIATIGFGFVVEPLVRAMGLPSIRVVACRPSFVDRRRGKLALSVDALGSEGVAGAMVVTDSEQDRPLLDRCAAPRLLVWPDARYAHACSGVYLPGQYITWIKRPGERYIFRGILQEDFAFWVLASIPLARHAAQHVLGLALLLLSFWAVYERGYVDNDAVAARYESDPKLSLAFYSSTVATPPVQPWIWAVLSGALGVAVLDYPARPAPAHLVAWGGVLVTTFAWFLGYNRCDKNTRAWMYLPLQLGRCVGFAAVVSVGTAGALALGAHALSRWFHYFVYRLGRGAWPSLPTELMRLVTFLVLAGLVALAQGGAVVATWSTAAIVAWSVFRARREVRDLIRSAGPMTGPLSRR